MSKKYRKTVSEERVEEAEEKPSIIEQLKEIGFEEKTAGVLFGLPNVGKTRLGIAIAKEFRMKEKPVKFIVTEANWFQAYRGKSIYNEVVEEFGSESVFIVDEIHKIFDVDIPDEAFVFVDSLGAIHLNLVAKFTVETLRSIKISLMEDIKELVPEGHERLSRALKSVTLPFTSNIVSIINSIVHTLTLKTLRKNGTILFVAHACGQPTEPYRKLINYKPSYGVRAGHSLLYEWFMRTPNEIMCVVHRLDESLNGKRIFIKL